MKVVDLLSILKKVPYNAEVIVLDNESKEGHVKSVDFLVNKLIVKTEVKNDCRFI